MISIIIRTKNEEKWIGECLKRIKRQKCSQEIEVVLVDNQSEDGTISKAKHHWPGIKVVEIDKYLPGAAINIGVRASSGDYFSVLSAHCLPVNENWLEAMYRNMEDPNVAGVYGRQIPMNYTDAVDKRDLLVTFGLDRIEQVKGSFFHNASSLVRRSIWEEIPFDDELTNIEDRIWGKLIISSGLKIIYEPDSCVFHYHGIHQTNNRTRLNNVVRILHDFKIQDSSEKEHPILPEDQDILAIIPFRKADNIDLEVCQKLLDYTMESVQESHYLGDALLFTDHTDLITYCEANYPKVIIRKRERVEDDQRLSEAFSNLLMRLADEGRIPDLVIPMELIYPFRPKGMLDKLIKLMVFEGFDTVLTGFPEFRTCWINGESGELERISRQDKARELREPIHIGTTGLGYVTYPGNLRTNKSFGKKVGIMEIDHPFIKLEIRNASDLLHLETMYRIFRETGQEKVQEV